MNTAVLTLLLFLGQYRPIQPIDPSKTVSVVARGIGPVPGALLCPDMETVQELFHVYADYYEESMQYVMTHGQSALLNGKPRKPNPAAYGCALVSPGTKMLLEKGNIVPVVRVTLPNGHKIRAVTQQNMLIEPELNPSPPTDTKSMAEAAAKKAPDISLKTENDQTILSSPNGPCARISKDGSSYSLKAFGTQQYDDYYLALVDGYNQCEGAFKTGASTSP